MRRLVVALGAMLLGGGAWGMPACGVLLTNVASATYRSQENWGSPGLPVAYNVTVNVLVQTPGVVTRKDATPTIQAPGGTVLFCISFSNASACASAANVVIEDVVPGNMNFAQMLTLNAPEGGVLTGAWSNNGGSSWTAVPPGAWPAKGTVNIALRWTVDLLGMGKSAYVCYRATIQ